MASGRRLTQLRAMVERLERLPASTRRDWLLHEARSRMVDVETDAEPRPMRQLDEERPATKPVPARRAPRRMPGVSTRPAPRSAPAPSRIAEMDRSPAGFGDDELLWLDDPSGDTAAEPGDGPATPAPWRRGLRG